MAGYLALCREDAKQREHSLRAVFNGLRYIVLTGNQWRFMPGDLPPWPVVYQQAQHWIHAGCLEIMVADLCSLLREFAGRNPPPTAMIVDSRTIQSTPSRGAGRIRRGQTAQGVESACRCRYAGTPACTAWDLRQRVGPGTGGAVGRAGIGNCRKPCGTGLCRSGIHGRSRAECDCRPWYPTGSVQAHPSQTRLRSAAPPLGRRLRTTLRNPRRLSHLRLRLPHTHSASQPKFIADFRSRKSPSSGRVLGPYLKALFTHHPPANAMTGHATLSHSR